MEITENVRYFVKLGQDIIDWAEWHGLFKDDDELWNAAVTAGNKLITVGTPTGIRSVNELKDIERKALYQFIEMRDHANEE
jgi:hypothetical protein